MWWCDNRKRISVAARLATVLTAASLLAGCFEPLYGHNPSLGDESVLDKLAEVLIAPNPDAAGNAAGAHRGGHAQRSAVRFQRRRRRDLADASSRRDGDADRHIGVDRSGHRSPTEEIGGLNATYQMVEIATGKIVLKDSTFAHVGYDIPGSQQRFAKQRALLDAEDRAAKVAAEAIRNRLASYFVAGT